MTVRTQNIVILISGSGSNMGAILEAAKRDQWQERYGARVAAVVSNRPEATGLLLAKERGIDTAVLDHRQFESRQAFDADLMRLIDSFDSQGKPAWVVLAGFMRILTPEFVAHYEGRLLNIHPSLLPAFPGLNTHRRALEEGCRFAGATVHHVTSKLDHGAILEQAVVPVLPSDDEATLAQRVLSQEHVIYPRALERLLRAAAAATR